MTVRPRERVTPSILLVEDDETDVLFIRRCLASLGSERCLVVARDGVEALEILASRKAIQKPYVIMTDLNMPGMSGHELIEQVRCTDCLRNSVIFVVSSSRLEADIERSYSKNVAGYITKDAPIEHLTANIRLLVEYCQTVHLPN